MLPSEITFDQVLNLALHLRPIDQARLVVRLASKVELLLEQVELQSPIGVREHRKPLRGLLADLGPAPSAEEIEEVQREMWASLSS